MKTTGPDSYLSWCVALACSIIFLLVTIPARLSGLIYVVTIEHFQSSREVAALPIIVFNVLKGFEGPLVGYLAEVFGLRSVQTLGCLLAALGMTVCYFAQDMSLIIGGIGVIHSAGFAICIGLTPSILKQHFQKNISNSNGLYFFGICVGAFVSPPIFNSLIESYGLTGAMLITSGIMLHAVPIALLLKNPNYEENSQVDFHTKADFEGPLSSNGGERFVQNEQDILSKSLLRDAIEKNVQLVDSELANSHTILIPPHNHEVDFTSAPPFQKAIRTCNNELTLEKKDGGTNDLFHSETKLPVRTQKRSYRKALKSLKIFWDPVFLNIMTTQSTLCFVIFFVWTIIVDVSRDKGIPTNLEIYVLMFMPVAEAMGYLCFGWITDKKFLTKTNFCFLSYLGVGLSCSMIAWSNSFGVLVAGAGVFGIFTSALTTVYPAVIFSYVEKEDQTMAMTSRLILHAPLSLLTGPLIGHFRGDSDSGSYNGLLHLLCGISVLCAIMIILLPSVVKCRTRSRTKHLSLPNQ